MSKIMVYKNIGQLLTLKGVVKKQGRRPDEKDLGVVKNAALVVENGQILWVGTASKLPSQYKRAKSVDCKKQNMFPGWIDCHTHLIFAGDRQNEFEQRVKGATYQEIAQKGGGILSTMKATRKANIDSLVQLGQERVGKHLSQGVTTIEVKSGYGLNKKTEEKMLLAAKQLKKARIIPTFLGAHAIPKNFDGEWAYLEQLKKDLKSIKDQKLSDRVDIFIEKNYFSVKGAREYLEYALDLGCELTIHADQLNRTGATDFAVELGALSADHVICANSKDIKKLANSETVAVMLPTADFYLQCDYPNAREFIDRGASFALATDFNPGSSPTQNIQFVGLLARLKMKMTLPEVIVGLTYGGAKALGKENQLGALLPGFSADFFLTDLRWDQLFYDLGEKQVRETFIAGKKVFTQK